jgi:hypothetical protein
LKDCITKLAAVAPYVYQGEIEHGAKESIEHGLYRRNGHPASLEFMHELAVRYKEQAHCDDAEQLLREVVDGY